MEENNNLNIDPSQIEKILSVMKLVNNMNSVNNQDNTTSNTTGTEIVEKMDGSHGIIYLDSGDYIEIKNITEYVTSTE